MRYWLTLGLLMTSMAWAAKWMDSKKPCPVCKEVNYYSAISKADENVREARTAFQLIFWPNTDEHLLHCCSKCGYTAYYWDFDNLPAEKVEAVRLALEGVKVPEVDSYEKIPMLFRLSLAEKVYQAWGRDDRFWCDFHKLRAYWLSLSKKNEEALAARKQALDLADKVLAAGRTKEMLFIAGSMRYFTGERKTAYDYLKAARRFAHEDKNASEDKVAEYEAYLNRLIDSFISRIEQDKAVPDR